MGDRKQFVLLALVIFAPSVAQQQNYLQPFCETACMEHISGVFLTLFSPGNITVAKENVCKHYLKAEQCMNALPHCSDSMYGSAMSGIQYMCIEQKDAFDILLDCIDMNSRPIKDQCDRHCNPSSLVAGLAVQDTVMQSLDAPIGVNQLNVRSLIEPHLGAIAFSESCRISNCLMGCYKSKFNMMCEGTAGYLIMEMLSRPLSSQQNAPMETQFLGAFLNGLLPQTCGFLTDKNNMKIDPQLNEDIKRMYANRKKNRNE